MTSKEHEQEEEHEQKNEIDLKARREELYDAWQRLFNLANSLLAQAEEDITSVRASMMQQIIRVLSNSGKILDDMEKWQKKVEEEPEIDEETGEEIRHEIIEKFYIGSADQVRMPISGRLFLGINENVVGDNSGEFEVIIYLPLLPR